MPLYSPPSSVLVGRSQLTANAQDLDLLIPVGSLDGLYRIKAAVDLPVLSACGLGIQFKAGAGFIGIVQPFTLNRGAWSISHQNLNGSTCFDAFLEVRKGYGVRHYQLWGRGWMNYDGGFFTNTYNWNGTTLSDSGNPMQTGFRFGEVTDTLDRITLGATIANGLQYNANYPVTIELWKIAP